MSKIIEDFVLPFGELLPRMGAEESTLGMPTKFSSDEINRLKKRFKQLDKDKSGGLSIEELVTIAECKDNPVLNRVVSIFDKDGNGEIEFQEFIDGVSIFCIKGNLMEKLHFAFKIYDIDNDGYISNGELFTVIKQLIGDNLQDVQLQQIVDKTIIYGDRDGDGKLSFEDFYEIICGIAMPNVIIKLNDTTTSASS